MNLEEGYEYKLTEPNALTDFSRQIVVGSSKVAGFSAWLADETYLPRNLRSEIWGLTRLE